MTPLLLVAVSGAGGVGAAMRLLLDGLIREWIGTRFPWGTAVINVTGAFLLGLVTALTTATLLPAVWSLTLGAGLLGGYTTFSTASFETVRLMQSKRWAAALGNGVGIWLIADLAAVGGYLIGR